MDKLLILNADDLGYDEETNDAVSELVREGLVSSVSLLAPGPASEDAAREIQNDLQNL